MLSGCTNKVEEPIELEGDVAYEDVTEYQQESENSEEDLELTGAVEIVD